MTFFYIFAGIAAVAAALFLALMPETCDDGNGKTPTSNA